MSNKKYVLYMHTSPSGKVYIGITCQTLESRCGANGRGYAHNPHFWSAIQKYGWDNFKHEVLLYDLSGDEASEKEKEYIANYRSNESRYGYNMTTGGEQGFTLTPDAVLKISRAAKEQWQKMTQEEKDARLRMREELENKRTKEEKRAIALRAQRTIIERYTAEERAERYRLSAEKCKATKAMRGGMTQEQRAAISERMAKYWEDFRKAHPKQPKKKKYYPPKICVRLTPDALTERRRAATKLLWENPEYRRAASSGTTKGMHWSLSEETKAKMRKPKSEETREKMSKAKRRFFDSMTPEQRLEFFKSRNRNR